MMLSSNMFGSNAYVFDKTAGAQPAVHGGRFGDACRLLHRS